MPLHKDAATTASHENPLLSNAAAVRILAKTAMLSLVSVIMILNSPHFLATVLGVVMQGVAFSWLYMVGLDCSHKVFFSRPWINEWVGTLALAPLLRPLYALREKGEESRALVSRLLTSFFGFSVSHLVVDVFLLGAIYMCFVHFSWVLKFWLLPLVFAHINSGSFMSSKSARAFLFPEVLDEGEAHVPLYSLDSWLPTAMHKASLQWQSPLWPATREFLLWKHRDVLLHACLVAGAVFSFMSGWAAVLPLVLVPFLAWQSTASAAITQGAAAAAADASSKKDRTYTRAQLWENPNLAAVDSIVFDLEKLAQVHPGGDQIRACGGTDCTGLFGSMHTFTAERNLQRLRDFQVGTLTVTPTEPQFDMNSAFAAQVRTAIRDELRGTSVYAPWQWWARTALIGVLTVVAEVWWATSGRLEFALAVGVLHSAIGICVQHDASHGAVSKQAWINNLLSYGADWIGNSRWLWFQQHIVGHHPHCNVEGQDPDAHSAEPLLQFHWLGNGRVVSGLRAFFLRYQHLYMYLVLPWYGPSVVYNVSQVVTMNHGDEVPTGTPWMMSKRPLAVLLRLFYVARLVLAPVLLAGVAWPVAVLAVPLVTGAVLTFVFLVSHNFRGSDRAPLAEGGSATDFYKLQVETSCSYGGQLAMMLTGGLNLQIEHHVVPRINSWHYPRLQKVLQAVCKKNDVRYVAFPSLAANLVDTFAYMKDTGERASSSQAAPAAAAAEEAAPREPLKIILHGKLVDVTRWIPRHPGGEDVMRVFDHRDATEQFEAMHSEAATKRMMVMVRAAPSAGEEAKPRSKAAAAYFKLRDEFVAEGLFETSVSGEVMRFLQNMAWYVAGYWLMTCTSYSWTGALVFGWGMQQSGWLSHDYLHHQVMDVTRDDWMGSFLGWMQGYDSLWWKYRHNLHHVATNEVENDPDIDLAPLLTYVNRNVSLNFVQSFQHIYFVPLLSLLHFSWCFSSMRHTISRKLWLRTAALVVYHVLIVTFVYRNPAGEFLLWPLLGSYLFKGMLTALFVFSTHYPEVRLPAGAKDMSLLEQTAITSRNISGGALVDWMSGGISKQIEHHLFPMLPRGRLAEIAPRVKKLSQDLGIPYNETSIVECMVANVACLSAKKDLGVELQE